MTRWEYRHAELDELHAIGSLARIGEEGWELVGFDGRGIAFFKRPMADVRIPAALIRNLAPVPAEPKAKTAAAK